LRRRDASAKSAGSSAAIARSSPCVASSAIGTTEDDVRYCGRAAGERRRPAGGPEPRTTRSPPPRVSRRRGRARSSSLVAISSRKSTASSAHRRRPTPKSAPTPAGPTRGGSTSHPRSGRRLLEPAVARGNQRAILCQYDDVGPRAGFCSDGASRTRTGDLLGAIQALATLKPLAKAEFSACCGPSGSTLWVVCQSASVRTGVRASG
jgi:hypothetical protein